MLRNPLVAVPSIFWHETEVAGRNLGVTLQPPELRGPEDFEAAIAAALAHTFPEKHSQLRTDATAALHRQSSIFAIFLNVVIRT